MSGGRLKLPILLIAFSACVLIPANLEGQLPSKVKPPIQQRLVSQPAPAPLSPAQMPALAPQVAYSSGQLTITAANSTLGDILRAVHRQTGASVDVPSNATERVVGKFGPGPARDVLASLLNGSHFNYFLLGSATNPNALDRVILTSRSGTGNGQPGESASAGLPGQPGQPPISQGDSQEAANDESGAEMQQELSDTLTDDQGNQQADEQQQQPNPFGQPSAVKTPEQLLQELQQRQQQLQQQQQQQQGQPQQGLPLPFPGVQPPPRQP